MTSLSCFKAIWWLFMVNNKILTFCQDNKALQVTSYEKSTLAPHRTPSLMVPQPYDDLQFLQQCTKCPFSLYILFLPVQCFSFGSLCPRSQLKSQHPREPSLPILFTRHTIFSFSPSLSSLHHSFKHHTHIILLLLLVHLP